MKGSAHPKPPNTLCCRGWAMSDGRGQKMLRKGKTIEEGSCSTGNRAGQEPPKMLRADQEATAVAHNEWAM
jgi:hypothetical protein